MRRISGIAVSEEIAIGRVFAYEKVKREIAKESSLLPENEFQRLQEALSLESAAQKDLYEKMRKQAGEKAAAIFDVYGMLLSDNGLIQSMEQMIFEEKVTAEYAVLQSGEKYAAKFATMDDVYMRERGKDIRDLVGRLADRLCGKSVEMPQTDEKVIWVAEDFAPDQIAGVFGENVLAYVAVKGSLYSHGAILARTLGIPMLVQTGIDLHTIENGMEAIVDGLAGELILEPDAEQKEAAMKKKEELSEQKALLANFVGRETMTLSGRKIGLLANAGSLEDVRVAFENDAEGIGLFRSEYLFMGRDTLPSEEEQFAVYKQIAEICGEKRAIIRTMDVGADKQAECLTLESEENPAMGYRGIRICLDKQEIFKVQLRAIYRAAVYGNLALMYPMIVSAGEVAKIQQISAEVKAELAAQGLDYKDVEEGIMVETPAAVMISDTLAEMVDFVSIGTNDLTQYTLAADRQNSKLAGVYNPRHEAILRMIKMVLENAHAAGIPVGICGELASDEQMAAKFVEMGVDELSVVPAEVLKLRKIICETE